MEQELYEVLRESLLAIIIPMTEANPYKPANYAYYVIREDQNEDRSELFSGDHYCEKCIEKKIAEAEREYPNDEVYAYDDLCPQSTGFATCEECGAFIDCGVILDDQELDHWLENEIDLSDKHTLYEIREILEVMPSYCDEEEDLDLARKCLEFLKKLATVIDQYQAKNSIHVCH